MYVDPCSPEETLGEPLSCLFYCHFSVYYVTDETDLLLYCSFMGGL